jgi:hypothetical protein
MISCTVLTSPQWMKCGRSCRAIAAAPNRDRRRQHRPCLDSEQFRSDPRTFRLT